MDLDKNFLLENELKSFENLWEGGYFEGDPLDPMGRSTYGRIGYMSVLYATYICCIKPYINSSSIVLEIGPGRGAWTKTFLNLNAREIWVLDALSAEHNNFYDYVGKSDNIKYFQVTDFTCNMLPENKFNYLFSYGCLCHVSFDGITQYMKNIYSKLQKGSHCFIMVADYEKYNQSMKNINKLTFFRSLPKFLKWLEIFYAFFRPTKYLNYLDNDSPSPGRWYNAGIDKTCIMLENIGYSIIQKDVACNYRDPVIHFIKS